MWPVNRVVADAVGTSLHHVAAWRIFGIWVALNLCQHPLDLVQVFAPQDAGGNGFDAQIVVEFLPLIFLSALRASGQAIALVENRHLPQPCARSHEFSRPSPQVNNIGDRVYGEVVGKDPVRRTELDHGCAFLPPLIEPFQILLLQCARDGVEDNVVPRWD